MTPPPDRVPDRVPTASRGPQIDRVPPVPLPTGDAVEMTASRSASRRHGPVPLGECIQELLADLSRTAP